MPVTFRLQPHQHPGVPGHEPPIAVEAPLPGGGHDPGEAGGEQMRAQAFHARVTGVDGDGVRGLGAGAGQRDGGRLRAEAAEDVSRPEKAAPRQAAPREAAPREAAALGRQ
ncbi:hypothetical protein H340_11840 [Streptomyces mobaraensis NBRC 13819 = DSM 40847]|uniref:Uncharacterized protein n=1 Tax=Streptomyces mobaraensis (strain ATCC 29032 / DSM 40847 / JCM 4168 / NBRC 13819 / NCIMB 11159 / IPCR 16-22) TaxID=1223523 RepID=M3C8I2_STRM1|nr:hypothetical protein H340_11840 [Streptomyces mobaraensis NBRC 13819 = DSM 40847]